MLIRHAGMNIDTTTIVTIILVNSVETALIPEICTRSYRAFGLDREQVLLADPQNDQGATTLQA